MVVVLRTYQKNVLVLWGPSVPCSLSRPAGVPAGSEASLLCVVVCKLLFLQSPARLTAGSGCLLAQPSDSTE